MADGRHPGIISNLDDDDAQLAGTSEQTPDRARASGLADLDFGEDWAPEDRKPEEARPVSSGVGMPGNVAVGGEFWAIVLSTFSGDNHAAAAANMISELASIDTSLPAKTSVHTKEVGSYVIYGRFSSPRTAEAKAALDRIRQIRIGENVVFPRAMFTRISAPVDPRRLPLHDLRSLRLRFPDEHPLYSLEVAVWVDDGDTEQALIEIQRKAEAEVVRLRAQGHEAYYFHDSIKRVSSITVGVFVHADWNAQANLESSRVQKVRQSFPLRLMNGERVDEVLIRDEVSNEPTKTIPMVPRLVLVPEL